MLTGSGHQPVGVRDPRDQPAESRYRANPHGCSHALPARVTVESLTGAEGEGIAGRSVRDDRPVHCGRSRRDRRRRARVGLDRPDGCRRDVRAQRKKQCRARQQTRRQPQPPDWARRGSPSLRSSHSDGDPRAPSILTKIGMTASKLTAIRDSPEPVDRASSHNPQCAECTRPRTIACPEVPGARPSGRYTPTLDNDRQRRGLARCSQDSGVVR